MTAAISPFRASLFLFWLPPPCVLSLPFLPTAGPAGLVLQHNTCTAALWGAAALLLPQEHPWGSLSAQLPPRAVLRDQSTLLDVDTELHSIHKTNPLRTGSRIQPSE